MEPFSILMFAFAGLLLLISLFMYLTGEWRFMRGQQSTRRMKEEDEKAYGRKLGKVLGLVAMAPVLSGISAMYLPFPLPMFVLFFGVIGLAIYGSKTFE